MRSIQDAILDILSQGPSSEVDPDYDNATMAPKLWRLKA